MAGANSRTHVGVGNDITAGQVGKRLLNVWLSDKLSFWLFRWLSQLCVALVVEGIFFGWFSRGTSPASVGVPPIWPAGAFCEASREPFQHHGMVGRGSELGI